MWIICSRTPPYPSKVTNALLQQLYHGLAWRAGGNVYRPLHPSCPIDVPLEVAVNVSRPPVIAQPWSKVIVSDPLISKELAALPNVVIAKCEVRRGFDVPFRDGDVHLWTQFKVEDEREFVLSKLRPVRSDEVPGYDEIIAYQHHQIASRYSLNEPIRVDRLELDMRVSVKLLAEYPVFYHGLCLVLRDDVAKPIVPHLSQIYFDVYHFDI